MRPRQEFKNPITCRKCGQKGAVTWAESGGGNRTKGSQRSIVSLSEGFRQEHGKTESGDAQLICNVCGAQIMD
jgi:hypothetical protein